MSDGLNSFGLFLVAILLILAFLIIPLSPLILAITPWNIFKGRKLRWPYTLAAMIMPLVLLYDAGLLGNSATRIRLDHALFLPNSAFNVECQGFISTPLDEDADATFEMPRAELPAFLGQLRRFRESSITYPTAPSDHPIHRFLGTSSDGNVLSRDVYDINPTHVRIHLHTFSG